jgi:hypothetical protein
VYEIYESKFRNNTVIFQLYLGLKLQSTFKKDIKKEWTLQDAIDVMCELSKEDDNQRKISKKSPVAVVPLRYQARTVGSKVEKELLHCALHGPNRTHNTNDCKELKKRQEQSTTPTRSSNSQFSPEMKKRYLENVICHNCGKKGHYANACTEKPSGNKPTVRAAKRSKTVEVSNESSDDDDEDFEDVKVSPSFIPSRKIESSDESREELVEHSNLSRAVQGVNIDDPEMRPRIVRTLRSKLKIRAARKDPTSIQDENSIFIPVSINKNKAYALVDSGANISVISLKSVKAMKISYEVRNGEIVLAGEGNRVTRIGITDPVELRVADHRVTYRFEIMELDDDQTMIIGLDLFKPIGIYIGGLPTSFPTDIEPIENPISEEDIETTPEIIPMSPALTNDEQNRFDATIRDVLKKNSLIQPGEYCTLPEAIVHIKTPVGATVYQRQYPIARNLHSTVDKSIQEWIELKVIVEASGSGFQNCITLAHKRDPFTGAKVDYRPCIDPRALNLITEEDKFPLPTIIRWGNNFVIYRYL